MQITPGYVSDALNGQAESIVRYLLPNGKKKGHEWCAGSTSGEAGESLKICIEGSKVGVWQDFASGEVGGDLLDLWCAVRNCDLKTAMDEACQMVGIRRPEFSGAKPKTYAKPERPARIAPALKSDVVADFFESRGISSSTVLRYKVASDGDTIIFPSLRDGELLHLKYRSAREKKFWASADTEKCLFGWQAIPHTARSVVLTEGELDALAMSEYGYPALSVPFGGGNKGKQDWIENEYTNLERFDTIYISMDMDDAGALAAAEIVDRLGRHRCRVVELPMKDANECLMDGVAPSVISAAIKGAKSLDPSELRNALDYSDAVHRRFGPQTESMKGFLLPWNRAAGLFHFGWGATTILSGQAGHGKSEITGQIVVDAMQQKVRACVASLEFKPDKWIARIVRQMTCTQFPEKEQVGAALDWLGQSLWAFEVAGRGSGTAKVDRLLEVFAYARARYGIRLFVIDNLTKCGIAEDDYNGQKAAITAITEFAVEHDVHIIVVAHQRKTDDEYSRGGKMGIKGSSSIGDLADNVWIIWRNRKKEFELKQLAATDVAALGDAERIAHYESVAKWQAKGDTYFSCEKYRDGDEEPYLSLFFDKNSHQFLMDRDDLPRRYA